MAVGAVVLLVVLLTRGSAPPPPTTQTSPTPTPVPTPTAQPLASLTSSASGSPVDGMQCASSEPTTNRFTAHLAVFVGGSARQIPAGVGIASPSPPIDTNAGPFVASGKCYYPLLTHTSDGIVQISMPAQGAVTLGNFFDIWGQPLTTGQVGPATGSVIVYVNGSKYTGDPRALTIAKHALIQLDVGMDTPPVQFAFPPGD